MAIELDPTQEIEEVVEENTSKPEPATTEPIKEEKKPEEIKVDLEDLKEPEPEKATVNIMDESFLDEHLEKKPIEDNKGTSSEKKSIKETRSVSELKDVYKKEEEESIDQLDYEDFAMIADFCIEGLEVGTVTIFRWWAMDKSDTNYEMTESKKKKLKELLTKIFIRYAVKFPLIWLFIFTLLLAHITPFLNAKENRKKMMAERPAKSKTATTGKGKKDGKGGKGKVTKPRGGQHK